MSTISSENNYAVEIKDLIKIYQHKLDGTKISALRGCDLAVKKGELISIIGPSGAGKTTLLLIIAGIVNASSGVVKVGNIPIQEWSETKRREFRRRFIGHFSQYARENLDPRMKVFDAISWEMLNAGWKTRDARERTKEILTDLNIRKLSNVRCGKLSAGETMRVALSKAVSKKPFVVLADEPTGQLDSENMNLLHKLMRKVTKSGTAILVATHDIRFQTLSDRALLILDGRLATEEYGENLLSQRESLFKRKNKEPEMVTDNTILDSSKSIRIPDHILRRLQIEKQVIITHNLSEDFARIKRNPEEIYIEDQSESIETPPFSRKNITNNPLIIAQGIGKTYRSLTQENQVLNNLSFTINQGEFVAILGPSGVGKTTLLNILTGLEKPSSGFLEVMGIPFHKSSEGKKSQIRLKNISYVTQNYVMHPFLSIEENVMLPNMLRLKQKIKDYNPLYELLETLGIKIYHKVFPTELSGGQQQRASLAAALYKGGDVIMVDEPTANLDSRLALQIMNILTGLAEKGKTIIAATHDYLLMRPGYRVIRLTDQYIQSDTIADEQYCTSLQEEYFQKT